MAALQYTRQPLIVLAFAIGTFSCLWHFSAYSRGGPQLHVEKSVVTFDQVPPGAEVEQFIMLKNLGSDEVVVSEIKTGCGCTDASLDVSHIKPDCSVPLRIAVRSSGQQDQRVLIYLFSNDAASPIKTIRVRVNPDADSRVEPAVVDFGTVERRDLATVRPLPVRLIYGNRYHPPSGRRDSPTSVISEAPYVVISSVKETAKGVEFAVSLSENAPTGDICTTISVSNLQTSTSLKVRLVGRVRGQLLALPQMVVFSSVTQSAGLLTREVRIKSRIDASKDDADDMKRRVYAVRVSDSLKGLVQCAWSTTSQDVGERVIILTLDPASYPGAWSTETLSGGVLVTCETGQDGAEELIIPVRVVLKGGKVRDK